MSITKLCITGGSGFIGTTAIQLARLDDVVIIAGKGHEQVQIVRDNYFPFSDFEQASVAIELVD